MKIDAPKIPANPESTTIPAFHVPVPKMVIGLFAAIMVITVLAFIGDARELRSVLSDFTWWLLIPVSLLSLWNYLLRFLKWQFFLRTLGVIGLRNSDSLRIFLAGFAMVLTPGKLGEFIKAAYVRKATGFPANRVASVVTAERATDAIAMAILALIGATRYSYGRGLLTVAIIGAIGAVTLLQRPWLLRRPLHVLQRLPIMARSMHHVAAFQDASLIVFSAPALARAVAVSLLSWSGECLAFYLILLGLGMSPSAELLLTATFILAISSLAGGISMLPGGLGVADASVAGMLLLLVHDDALTTSVAIAATLLIRFATLWFAVIIGVFALVSIERRQKTASRGRIADSTTHIT